MLYASFSAAAALTKGEKHNPCKKLASIQWLPTFSMTILLCFVLFLIAISHSDIDFPLPLLLLEARKDFTIFPVSQKPIHSCGIDSMSRNEAVSLKPAGAIPWFKQLDANRFRGCSTPSYSEVLCQLIVCGTGSLPFTGKY